MEIKDEGHIWRDCQNKVLEMIKGITKETESEQKHKYLHDPVYHTTIDCFTQIMFTIKTDRRFIEAERKAWAEMMYHDMKGNLKLYGVDID